MIPAEDERAHALALRLGDPHRHLLARLDDPGQEARLRIAGVRRLAQRRVDVAEVGTGEAERLDPLRPAPA